MSPTYDPKRAPMLSDELVRDIIADADEIISLREKVAELVAVLEMIASLRHDSNPSAASLAKSALDTMRLLNDPN